MVAVVAQQQAARRGLHLPWLPVRSCPRLGRPHSPSQNRAAIQPSRPAVPVEAPRLELAVRQARQARPAGRRIAYLSASAMSLTTDQARRSESRSRSRGYQSRRSRRATWRWRTVGGGFATTIHFLKPTALVGPVPDRHRIFVKPRRLPPRGDRAAAAADRAATKGRRVASGISIAAIRRRSKAATELRQRPLSLPLEASESARALCCPDELDELVTIAELIAATRCQRDRQHIVISE